MIASRGAEFSDLSVALAKCLRQPPFSVEQNRHPVNHDPFRSFLTGAHLL
jgi:hypothetical protein